jgi:hypothetical protein
MAQCLTLITAIKKGKILVKHTRKLDSGAIFDRHIKHEFEDKDVDATMETMVKEPYVHNVPVMTGSFGHSGV